VLMRCFAYSYPDPAPRYSYTYKAPDMSRETTTHEWTDIHWFRQKSGRETDRDRVKERDKERETER